MTLLRHMSRGKCRKNTEDKNYIHPIEKYARSQFQQTQYRILFIILVIFATLIFRTILCWIHFRRPKFVQFRFITEHFYSSTPLVMTQSGLKKTKNALQCVSYGIKNKW